jgi:hypothetical protein
MADVYRIFAADMSPCLIELAPVFATKPSRINEFYAMRRIAKAETNRKGKR